jgi:putative protease
MNALPPLRRPELLAPAGNWDCLRAAVSNGADAVYFGLGAFNARMRAENFTLEDLPAVVEFLHARGRRAHVALNTLIFTRELEEAAEMLRRLEAAGADVVIVQDLGLAWLARRLAPHVAVHASTQMTVTSPEGARFAARLGVAQIVLARELSLSEIAGFAGGPLPVEVFVHGALCVAYSGQCLTSESLGQRSANRGECAQACRQTYDLIVDGVKRDLGDRRYLLSPQDLAALGEVPELIRLGVRTFKIEGRLKSPEYVAAATQVYRRAIDDALAKGAAPGAAPLDAVVDAGDLYKLEMVFSRGLYTGWLRGDNHQELVHARFGTKRGPFVGRIGRVGRDHVELAEDPPEFLHRGDGVVFDTGGDTNDQQGGRVYEVAGRRLFFEHGKIEFRRLRPGHRIWKTDDPRLMRELRRSFEGKLPEPRRRLDVAVRGRAGGPLVIETAALGRSFRVESDEPLEEARRRPLDAAVLREQLGRLGGTPFELGDLALALDGPVMLPLSALNRCRRRLVEALLAAGIGARDPAPPREPGPDAAPVIEEGLRVLGQVGIDAPPPVPSPPHLSVLCRTLEQLDAALDAGATSIYADFEDIRRYREAAARARARRGLDLFLATPRIQKPRERGFFEAIVRSGAGGILVRNLGAIECLRGRGLRLVADYSLNVANPLSAALLLREGFERLTASYDLDAAQLEDLLASSPPGVFEVTLHQHMPMFHMEHCVFAAALSTGKDHTDCGHPCDRHRVELRDHVGAVHPLKADVGCRNTLFNARAQSGAAFHRRFAAAGAAAFRVELLDENAAGARRTVEGYRRLLDGDSTPAELIGELKAMSQLGVTLGTLKV